MTYPAHKFTVAICGGGVGGLACAVALAQFPDIHVDIYEAASQFAEIGAGIGMWPRTWKIMKNLGLDRELAKVAVVPPNDHPQVAFHFRKGDQPEGQSFHTLVTPGGMIAIHRPDFQTILLRHLSSSCRTYTAKRLLSYTQQGSSSALAPLTLHFHDGSHASCDVLIGADGVKSAVRASLVRELAAHTDNPREAEELLRAAEPRWSGTSAYRATIPADVLRARLPGHRVLSEPTVYLGKNTQLTVYPIARGTLINFAALRARYDLEDTRYSDTWVEDTPREELLRDFQHWEPEVQALLQCVAHPSRWAIHTSAPLRTFVSGRVALVGDAAHAMMPYQGAGAGQAVEDAYLLAQVLGHARTTRTTLARALRIYDVVRRPCAQRVAELSRENGLLYTLNASGLSEDLGGEPDLEDVARRICANWKWAWETTVDADVERALEMVES
ncbi:salicylate hydroxylase [Amylocystis lapponica]|nr:salicylate hydroxylase [Amylocystis lapponica]